MNDSVTRLRAFSDEYLKIATELTAHARSEIAPKNFALTSKQSNTGKPAYPIEDEAHAKSALGLVGMHGSAQQKSEVYADVAKKYPQLIKEKKAGFMGTVTNGLKQVGEHLHKHEDAYELGGLGVLGAIGADRLQAHARAGAGASNHAIEKKQMLGESGHAALDTAGLGMLAAPLAAKKLLGH
jgi:hypothetical protein